MDNKTMAEAVESIIDTFMFFGDPSAPYWLMGLEESHRPNEQALEEFIESVELRSNKCRDANYTLSLRDLCGESPGAVSYTHLTLPTKA